MNDTGTSRIVNNAPLITFGCAGAPSDLPEPFARQRPQTFGELVVYHDLGTDTASGLRELLSDGEAGSVVQRIMAFETYLYTALSVRNNCFARHMSSIR